MFPNRRWVTDGIAGVGGVAALPLGEARSLEAGCGRCSVVIAWQPWACWGDFRDWINSVAGDAL